MGKEGQKRGGRRDQWSRVPWAQGGRAPGPRHGHVFTAAGLPWGGRRKIKGGGGVIAQTFVGATQGRGRGDMSAVAPVFVIKSKWGPLLRWGWLVALAASSDGCRMQ